MDVAALLAGAQERAGSDDYGPEADAMLEALEVLVRSANDEADLGRAGRDGLRGMIVSLLTRRLADRALVRRRIPRSPTRRSSRCCSALGLPRTGSTALELPPRPGPGGALAAHVGGDPAHATARARDRGHRPALPRRPGGDGHDEPGDSRRS